VKHYSHNRLFSYNPGASMERHLATSRTTSSQPLMLLLAIVVYDLPTWTVSLWLAVDSARIYGCLAFDYTGPTVWNLLPDDLRYVDSFDSFNI